MTYLPANGTPFTVSMGLRAMDPNDWIEIDEHYENEIAKKRELLSENRQQVFATMSQGEAGSLEVLEKLRMHLPQRFPLNYPAVINVDARMHPLEQASLLVQEDLVIMSPQDDQWILTAACVCFPSRWNLLDKIGQNLHVIHDPVPHYEERIGHATDAMFSKFTPDRPVWRINWTVLDSPELFQPSATGRKARAHESTSSHDFGFNAYFRTERQTLWALETGDVLFTIRSYVNSLTELDHKYPEFKANLWRTMMSTSDQTRAYKGWGPLWADLQAWAGAYD